MSDILLGDFAKHNKLSMSCTQIAVHRNPAQQQKQRKKYACHLYFNACYYSDEVMTTDSIDTDDMDGDGRLS